MAPLTTPVLRGRRVALPTAVAAAIGAVVLAIGLAVDPARAWLSYLWAFSCAFTVAVGGLVFLMIGYAMNAKWVAVVRRLNELVTAALPVLAVLFAPLLFGLGWLYPWHTPPEHLGAHEREVLAHRAAFANTPAFIVRAAVYFAVLLVASLLLRRWSRRRDREASDDPLRRERRFSSAMLPPVAFALTFAVIDWIMSLQAVWFSSIFGVYVFAGGFAAAIGLVTVLGARTWRLGEDGGPITRHHFHALGRLLLAFTVFWAYAAYFQALLIRIANKPEEVTFYLTRIEGTWAVFVWILIVGHFALPFLFLLPRSLKFRPRAMAIAGAWLVLVHFIDMYWLVIPTQVRGGLVVHWVDLGAIVAVLGTCVAFVAWRHDRVPLFCEHDPFLADGSRYRSPL